MKPLAVYVHIPFCVQKCGYCDFNAYAGMDRLKPAYHRAVEAELEGWSSLLARSEVTSVSFGGGTPGESGPADLVCILERTRTLAGNFASDAELSLEANPGTTSGHDLAHLAEGGFNRVSFGAQSFDADELRFLDRIHSPEAIAASVANARRAGFASLGLDLIYGLPAQTLAGWSHNLLRALDLGVDHLSCYALTVEEGTPLAALVARGSVSAPDADLAAEMYELAEERLAAGGYRHYEISNWARPGHESRHNLVYWHGGDYLGLGAGAHGFLSGERYANEDHPRRYTELAMHARVPFAAAAERGAPTPAIAMFDWLETHLRLVDGFPPSDFEAAFGEPLSHIAGPVIASCEHLGLVEHVGVPPDRLRLTPRGRLLHSEVCARLLAHLQENVAPATSAR